MLFNKLKKYSVLLLVGLLPVDATAEPAATTITSILAPSSNDLHNQKLYDTYPWMLTYYYGVTSDTSLIPLVLGHFDKWPETVQSAELAKTLAPDNGFRNFFHPIVNVVQLAANIAVRHGKHEATIYEFNPYIAFRWANLPWNDYVTTSFAIGEGVSYASSVPYIEKIGNDNVKRLLNYLMLEATFALPQYPRVQLIARIHHRSGAFGLYQADNSGSNNIGLAIRYLFD